MAERFLTFIWPIIGHGHIATLWLAEHTLSFFATQKLPSATDVQLENVDNLLLHSLCEPISLLSRPSLPSAFNMDTHDLRVYICVFNMDTHDLRTLRVYICVGTQKDFFKLLTCVCTSVYLIRTPMTCVCTSVYLIRTP